jgi:uncharacterized protein YjbJ (UPF0337 family)
MGSKGALRLSLPKAHGLHRNAGRAVRKIVKKRFLRAVTESAKGRRNNPVTSGKSDQAKGRIKEAVGVLTNDKSLEREGKIDRAVGSVKEKAEEALDQIKEKAGSALDKVQKSKAKRSR